MKYRGCYNTKKIHVKPRLACLSEQVLSSEVVHLYSVSSYVILVFEAEVLFLKSLPFCNLVMEPSVTIMFG